ncbi:MAG: CopD family protein [Acidobacteriota bacterium]|nr:CopD family protein [Acidobacteriota bacterium]
MDGETFALVLLAGAKWITCAGLIGLTGAVAVGCLSPSPSRFVQPGDGIVERRLGALAAGSAVVLLAGTAARLYAQTWSVFGLDEPVTLELVRVVGIDSRWGGRWQPQAGFAVLAAVAAVVWQWSPRGGWWTAAVAVGGAWITLPLTGHAMSFESRLPWVAQVAHGIGAGAWIGALAALVAIVSGLARRPVGQGPTVVLAGRFSPLAVAAVGLIAVSGAITAVFYVTAFADLWTTGYGRVLLLKVVLFLATGAIGAYNWRILLPRLGTGTGVRALLRSARLELTLAAAVLLATAVLVHLAIPSEME